ncbi:MAG: ribonuclease Y [Candidatus Chisholmbacteria bacterium]|nr:ribonuclease Y [Candidatus Chisholmbacteria bacterium]
MSLFSSFSRRFSAKKAAAPSPKPQPSSKAKIAPAAPALLAQAQAQAHEIIFQAKDEALKLRELTDRELASLRQEVTTKTRQIGAAEAVLNEKLRHADERLEEVRQLKEEIEAERESLREIKKKGIAKLEKVASFTREEAKKELLTQIDREIAEETARRIRDAEDKAKEEAESQAQNILVDAMKHGATDYVAEYTVSAVKIPDEDVKGRIIGKEGRNIRTFERATGVDLDMDETPGEVRLSSFDSVRREIARLALERLIADGRIQPSRIEEYVAKAKNEVERIMFEEGKKLAHAVGVYSLPRELLTILGRFKFRSSYGQNMISHTLEETKIGLSLAREVGANVDTVRLGCLLHDIGKVVSDEEGSHVELGIKLLKKYNLPQEVIDCVAQHHEDTAFTSNEAVLVYIADAISGARPGARYEDYEEYVKRLTKLEEVAKSFAGISEAYAIQAGREIRVLVNPEKISDSETTKLAHDLKQKIQTELTYPGVVKINVIREVRASETAT